MTGAANDAAEALAPLSPRQRAAIYPGPGNPEYARGHERTMRALEARGLVTHVALVNAADGGRGARLTPRGAAVRALLAASAAAAHAKTPQ